MELPQSEHPFGERELLREAKEFTSELRAVLSDRLCADEISPNVKIPYTARVVREALLHRAWDLADAACGLFEASRPVPAYTLTRAVLETAALLFVLHKETRAAVDADSLGNFFDEVLMKAMFGRRDDPSGPHQAYNVLTLIGHLDKYLASVDAKNSGLMNEFFAGLCEYAHPNWAGTLLAYHEWIDEQNSRFGADCGRDCIQYGLRALRVAVSIAFGMHQKLSELDERFRALCERELL